jgi:hypothetical protein
MADAPDLLADVLPADRIPVVKPDGSLASVRSENYEKALAQGARLQSADEQAKFHSQLKFGDRPIAAGAAGAVRGATVGLSDVVGPALGVVDRSTLRGLKEENPLASTVGDVAGTTASLFVPGLQEASGPALVARLGRAAQEGAGLAKATSLGGRMLGRVVAGGVEGSLFGAGNAVTEAALGDPNLAAEKLISHVGLGGVLGSVGGVAGGALGDAVNEATGGIGKLLKTTSEDFAAKAIGGIQSSFKGMEKEEIRAIARDVIDSGIIGKTDRAIDILPKIKAAKELAGQDIGAVLDAIDTSGGPKFDFARGIARLRAFHDGLNEAEKDIIGAQLEKKITQLERTAAKGGGFRDVNELKSTMQGEINYKSDADAKLKLMKQAVGIFRDEIDTQLKAVTLPEEFAKFQKAKDLYGSFAEAEKWGKRGAKALLGNRTFSLTDYLGASGLSHLATGPVGAVLGAAGAVGNKLMRERGPALATNALEGLAARQGGGLEPLLAATLQRSATGALPAAEGLAASDLLGGDKEQRSNSDRGRHLDVLNQHIEDHDDEIDRHIDRVMDGDRAPHSPVEAAHASQDHGAKRMRRERPEAHDALVNEMAGLAANPQRVAELVAENSGQVAAVAPGVTQAMTQRAVSAVKYLARAAAVPAPAGPMAPKWHTSEAERHTYAQKVEVVRDPLRTVMRHAAAGTLTSTQMEALRAVYPGLARAMSDKALERIAEGPKNVPYRAKMMLSLLSGIDVDGSQSQAAIASNQAASRGKSQSSDVARKPVSRSEQTLAARTALPQQQREIGAGDA